MSRVYIKGMEMPSGCEGCYFLLDCGICCMLMAADSKHKTVGEYRWEENERHPDCPLIPVPDHGDLIDRGALGKAMNKFMWGRGTVVYNDAVLFVQNAPTIIPADADEGDNHA